MATDPSQLSLTPEEIAELAPQQHAGGKSKRSKFIIFPVEWQYQLARVDADKCSYRVALYLLWEAWRSQSKRVKRPTWASRNWAWEQRANVTRSHNWRKLG